MYFSFVKKELLAVIYMKISAFLKTTIKTKKLEKCLVFNKADGKEPLVNEGKYRLKTC